LAIRVGGEEADESDREISDHPAGSGTRLKKSECGGETYERRYMRDSPDLFKQLDLDPDQSGDVRQEIGNCGARVTVAARTGRGETGGGADPGYE
jgi:hypothetical protein